MDLENLITEVYDTANKSYPAYNSPPRKDFVPNSAKNTPNFPYQRQDDVTNPPPESIPSIPWPLGTAIDDIADSFVFLATAMNKISMCVKHNPSLTANQREDMVLLFKKAKKALTIIKHVGYKLPTVANIAGAQPSQNPLPNPPEKLPESDPIKAPIKIRVR